MSYIEPTLLREFAEAPEADNNLIWEQLAAAASRLFDRACNAPDGFFDKADGTLRTGSYPGRGTAYIRLLPYLPDSITQVIEVSASGVERVIAAGDYSLRDGYLILLRTFPDWATERWSSEPPFLNSRIEYKITAKFGFSTIPADLVQAVIEQALMMWRRKDLAFTELSGIPTAVAQAAYSPTFKIVSEKYRALYSSVAIG